LSRKSLIDGYGRWAEALLEERCGGNKSKMARETGVGRDTIVRLIAQQGLPEETTIRRIADRFGPPPKLPGGYWLDEWDGNVTSHVREPGAVYRGQGSEGDPKYTAAMDGITKELDLLRRLVVGLDERVRRLEGNAPGEDLGGTRGA